MRVIARADSQTKVTGLLLIAVLEAAHRLYKQYGCDVQTIEYIVDNANIDGVLFDLN